MHIINSVTGQEAIGRGWLSPMHCNTIISHLLENHFQRLARHCKINLSKSATSVGVIINKELHLGRKSAVFNAHWFKMGLKVQNGLSRTLNKVRVIMLSFLLLDGATRNFFPVKCPIICSFLDWIWLFVKLRWVVPKYYKVWFFP